MKDKYDFSGWATRANLKCSDGRIILKDAFKHNDGQIVPLVWNHGHNDPLNVLGHALLENREEGVYAYGLFNDTEAGRNAKTLVEHGDVTALSIYANQLKQQGPNVLHGAIREVSLVLAGANPGAFIDSIIRHGEESDEEAVIYTGENLSLAHADEDENKEKEDNDKMPDNKEKDQNKEKDTNQEISHAEGKTVKEVFDTLNEEQKTVVYAMIGQALDDANKENNEKEGKEDMKHNVFDQDQNQERENVLSHSDMETIIKDGKRYGSLKESFMAHAADYGIDNIDYLFPDAKNINNQPDFISREMGWVQKVMRAVHHTPFSRIKTIHADITADEARALGYMKGNLKKEEVFTLLKRTTEPQTIYKKQKLDRDDIIDITDFDVVAYIKSEMRIMLDEEIARAILVGDGRLSDSDDKIKEDKIRPIITDSELYTVRTIMDAAKSDDDDVKAKAFIKACIKSRKNYKGSGEPTLFTSEDMVTNCLLLEDNNGRIIYDSVAKLATALRVKEIVAVPVMENLTVNDTVNGNVEVVGVYANLKDYNVGADKGGAIAMFDDFDIDYNQQKYLIETRCSGALVKPFSAVVIHLSLS